MIVIDASAVLELLLNTPPGARVAHRIAPADETLHAPHVLDLEVTQVLRRYALARLIDGPRAEQVLDDLHDLGIERYPHDVLLPRIWQLRHNVTAYDAAYLTLAETLAATLITFDERLSAVPGVDARVEVMQA
jgi:predicted nucleic acid-binding protein